MNWPNVKRVIWSELSNYRLIGVGRLSGNRMLLDHALSGLSWRPQWFYEVQHLSTSLGLVEAGPSGYQLSQPGDAGRGSPNAGQHPVGRARGEPFTGAGLPTRRASLSPAAEKFVSILLEQWEK